MGYIPDYYDHEIANDVMSHYEGVTMSIDHIYHNYDKLYDCKVVLKKDVRKAIKERNVEVIKEMLDDILTYSLFGLPFASKTLTVRKEMNLFGSGEVELVDVEPRPGIGIKRIVSVLEKIKLKNHIDFEVYSKEEEHDRKLYVDIKPPFGPCFELDLWKTF